jgi:hypothetical protein
MRRVFAICFMPPGRSTFRILTEIRTVVNGPWHGIGYDWVVCLKLDTKPNPSFFAVFFEGEKIKHVRRSVQIDQCELADYSPLMPPVPPPAKKTQIKRKASGGA